MTKINYPIGGYAPGFYWCTCHLCGEQFDGDKYSRQCEPCAINMVNENNKIAHRELYEIKQSLLKFKEGIDVIMKVYEQPN